MVFDMRGRAMLAGATVSKDWSGGSKVLLQMLELIFIIVYRKRLPDASSRSRYALVPCFLLASISLQSSPSGSAYNPRGINATISSSQRLESPRGLPLPPGSRRQAVAHPGGEAPRSWDTVFVLPRCERFGPLAVASAGHRSSTWTLGHRGTPLTG